MSKVRLSDNQGVRYCKLGDIGTFYGGLSGKNKDDFVQGNSKYITYMNVFSNIEIDFGMTEMVNIEAGEKQNSVAYGDIIFTGSSETMEECAMASVVTTEIGEEVYLNSFCFGFRLNTPEILLPDFSKHLFRSYNVRRQLISTASGVTRFNVSKKKMADVLIPIPEIDVQKKIIEILDSFNELIENLETEYIGRKTQMDFYLRKLLDFSDEDTEWITIGEVCDSVCSGGTPKSTNEAYYGGDIPWLRTQEVDWKYIYSTEKTITQDGYDNSSAKWVKENSVIVAMYGATAGKAAINKIPLTTNQACCNLHFDPQKMDYKFAYYWICKEYLNLKSLGQGSQSNINAGTVKSFPIPLISLDEQKRIINILDGFEALCMLPETGLLKELELRRKQYEYYRDDILSFKEVSS